MKFHYNKKIIKITLNEIYKDYTNIFIYAVRFSNYYNIF